MALLEKAKEKLAGVFGSDGEEVKEPINTPEQQKIVAMAKNDYEHFKAERQRHEAIWKQEQRFYKGDHWYGLRPDDVSQQRPNSVDNVAFSQIESITSKLCSWMPYPEFEPQEPNDDEKAATLNAYMPYELKQIRFQQKHIRAVRRMVIHGPLIYKVIYDPTVEGGSGQFRFIGQNDIIPVDLGTFFPDPRIRDFIELQKGSAHMFHFRKPLEYFRQKWPKQGKKVQPDMEDSDVNIHDTDDYSMRNFNADRTPGDGSSEVKTAGLIEYWYRGKPKLMTKEDKDTFADLAMEKLMEGKDPSEAWAKAEGKMSGVHCVYLSVGGVFLEHKSYVYDHGQYPIVARTLFPDEDNPWGKGYMRDMIKPQIMLNKFAELAVETMAKQGTAGLMYEPDAIPKVEKYRQDRSKPGYMVEVNRLDGVKEMQGVQVSSTVFNLLEYYKEMLQKIPGQFDSANGQSNSNVTSGEQAKALISAANNRLIISTELIEDALCEVFEQYISDMAQFYTTERIGRVTGKQVAISRKSMISTMESEVDISDPETGAQETRQVMEEYLPKFDINVKIGAEKPTDREYYIQMAFNLLQTLDPMTGTPMIDAEAVRYTVQNGRMESFDVIDERMQREQMIQQQLQQLQQQNEEMQQQLQGMQQQLGQVDEQRQMMDAEKLQNERMRVETDRMKAVGDQEFKAAQLMQQGQQAQDRNILSIAQMNNRNTGRL